MVQNPLFPWFKSTKIPFIRESYYRGLLLLFWLEGFSFWLVCLFSKNSVSHTTSSVQLREIDPSPRMDTRSTISFSVWSPQHSLLPVLASCLSRSLIPNLVSHSHPVPCNVMCNQLHVRSQDHRVLPLLFVAKMVPSTKQTPNEHLCK